MSGLQPRAQNADAVLSWIVGDRNVETGSHFIDDPAQRIANSVRLTIDGRKVYLDAIAGAFS
jgi:hypothetical protein